MIDSSGVGRTVGMVEREGECGNGGEAVGMDGGAQQVTDGSRGTWENSSDETRLYKSQS